MTREEAKGIWPIIKAFAENDKDLQISYYSDKTKDFRTWIDFSGEEHHLMLMPDVLGGRYRIKPPRRPFKSIEEFWEETAKHEPIGYLRKIEDSKVYPIDNIDGSKRYFEELATKYTYVDGAYLGIHEIASKEDK